MPRDRGELVIIACESGKALAGRILDSINSLLEQKGHASLHLTSTREVEFANKEVKTIIEEPIRGSDVYVIQLFDDPLSYRSPNDNLMALYTAINAAKQSDAEHITAVIPQFPYSRQEKRLCREAITAKLVVDFIELSGANRVITLDIHSPSIAGFFQNTKFDNIEAKKLIVNRVREIYKKSNLVIVSPDIGGTGRAKTCANMLNTSLAMIYKQRDYAKKSTIIDTLLIGDVEGRDVLLVDDMVATGGTFIKAMELLKKHKANDIYVSASMPFFNNNACRIFSKAYSEGLFTKFIGTDAVFHGKEFIDNNPWYEEVSIAPLFASVIYNINNRLSISPLLA